MAREDQIFTRFYESARAEIIQRISLRDQALFAYVLIVGGYLAFLFHDRGFTLSSAAARDTLLVGLALPVICLLFTFVIIQHHLVISDLGVYLKTEWPKNVPERLDWHHWDNSDTLRSRAKTIQTLRTLAQCAALCVPFGYDLALDWLNWPLFFSEQRGLLITQVIVSTMSFVAVVAVHVYAHRKRLAAIQERAGGW